MSTALANQTHSHFNTVLQTKTSLMHPFCAFGALHGVPSNPFSTYRERKFGRVRIYLPSTSTKSLSFANIYFHAFLFHRSFSSTESTFYFCPVIFKKNQIISIKYFLYTTFSHISAYFIHHHSK